MADSRVLKSTSGEAAEAEEEGETAAWVGGFRGRKRKL